MTVDTKKRPAEPEIAREEPSQASAEYQVGYGKPPRETQFKKGQSGNPRGTRKPMSAPEIAAKVLARLVTIPDGGGKHRRATVQEVILIAQAGRAAKGDTKSARMLLDLSEKAPPPPEEYSQADMDADLKEAIVGFTLEQLELLNEFDKRMAKARNKRRSKK